MPRHPPIALTTLNRSHCQCSSSIGFGIPILLACARRGSKPDHTDKPHIKTPKTRLPFTTRFIRQCHRRVRWIRFIGATPSSSLAVHLKTSFSRSNPVPRGQATVIRPSVRDLFAHACPDFTVRAPRGRQTIGDGLSPYLSFGQQRTIQSDKLPTYLQSLTNLRPAKPSKGSSGKGSDMGKTHTWKPPDQSSLHNFAEQAPGISPGANLFFFKGYLHRHLDTKLYWWS